MSFPTYQEYKNIGVKWLGQIPSGWDVKRFKQVFVERDERSTDGSQTLLSVSAYTGVSPRSEIRDQDEHISRSESLEGYKVCYPNDLVINIMLAWNRGLGVSSYYGIVSPAYCVFKIIDESEPDFLDYLVRTDEYTAYFKAFSSGVIDSRLRIYPDTLGALNVGLPNKDEQKIIAKFLNYETAKIDMLVAEQEKLIGLLKEKRQVVISNAVTKGLDPAVNLKGSGVEWLGEVPEHWKVLKIKRLSAVQRGASPRPIDDPKYFDDEGEYGWVRISDVSSSNGVLRNTEQKLSALGSSLSVKIEPKQLFISIAGTVGKPCISAIKACIHDGFVYFPNLKINPWWLFRIFEAGVCYGGLGKLGTQLNLNTDTVGSISIGVPPDQEVDSILSFIQITLEKFDGLISEAQKVIDLSLERRSSLISAAVTGQIDVRNYQPKEIA